MLIIWGFRDTDRELGTVDYLHCNRCNNDSNWRLQRTTSWFTLFFIPVIPYRRVYYVYCPICRWTTEIPKAEAKRIMERNEAATITQS
ncbi:zinc ribbon domain-containing protein [Lachnospiraceae bacterium 38-10]